MTATLDNSFATASDVSCESFTPKPQPLIAYIWQGEGLAAIIDSSEDTAFDFKDKFLLLATEDQKLLNMILDKLREVHRNGQLVNEEGNALLDVSEPLRIRVRVGNQMRAFSATQCGALFPSTQTQPAAVPS